MPAEYSANFISLQSITQINTLNLYYPKKNN